MTNDPSPSVDIETLHAKKLATRTLVVALFGCALLLTLFMAIWVGPVRIPPDVVAKICLDKIPLLAGLSSGSWSANHETIVIDVRLPRALLGMIVGSALAVGGCAMQALFRNPLATPYIVGISSGAALGAALAMVLGITFGGIYSIPLVAFITATLTVFVVYNIARVRGRVPIETLLLAGIAVSAFLSALVGFMQYIARQETLAGIVFWIMGGLWASDWDKVLMALPLVIIGIGGIFLYWRDLNLMLLAEQDALALGVSVEQVRRVVLVFASLATAAAVSVSGVIGFVCLITPHIMRILVGPDHRVLLPSSCLGGAIFLIWADTLARTAAQPAELPVGIITALFGAPFFVYLLKRRRRVTGW